MKKHLYLFWLKVMLWESKRLRKKTNKLADKLTKVCEQEFTHNNRIARLEQIVIILSDKV
jgi:uncharacterized membrane protein